MANIPSRKQTSIIRELDVRPVTSDFQQEIERAVNFLVLYLKEHAQLAEALILGISGGQDSTLTGILCRLAVDRLNTERSSSKPIYKFVAVRLPYGEQADEEDCVTAIAFIKPDEVITVNIKDAVDASCASLRRAGIKISDFDKGNEKARERMKAQYSIASFFKGLVVGTDHAAEALTGFFTKYGDGGTDLNPLHGLTKRQGRKMLETLGCPKRLYEKLPTADLEDNKPGLPDEVALGVTYDQIDDYLEGKIVPDSVRERIESLYERSAHKRKLPATPA